MVVTSFRGLARRFIPEMIQKGMSAGGGLRFLQGKGLGYRKTDFLRDFREMTGREMKRDPLQSIPKKYKPTWDTIEMSEYRQAAKLHYSYKITGYDRFKQANVEDWVTVASDDVLDMQEAMKEAQRLLEKYKSELVVDRIKIDSVTSNIGQEKT